MTEPRAALARIPAFRDVDPGDVRARRLGGLVNRSYRIDSPLGCFVLRLAGEGTADYVDRRAEARDARLAACIGVGPEVVFFDEDDGTMLCRFVEGSVAMNAGKFRESGAVRRAAVALRRLHDGGVPFSRPFDPFAAIDRYRARIGERDGWLPDGCDAVLADAAGIRRVLDARALPCKPCHGDPVAENFLDAGGRMYLVDYEFAGNGDPLWDLAYLSLEAGFDAARETILFEAYFEGAAPAFARARATMYRAAGDLVSSLWAALRDSSENPLDKGRSDSENRLRCCRAFMSSDGFRRQFDILRRR